MHLFQLKSLFLLSLTIFTSANSIETLQKQGELSITISSHFLENDAQLNVTSANLKFTKTYEVTRKLDKNYTNNRYEGLAIDYKSSCIPNKMPELNYAKKYYYSNSIIFVNASDSFSCSFEMKLNNIKNLIPEYNFKAIGIYGFELIDQKDIDLIKIVATNGLSTEQSFLPSFLVENSVIGYIQHIIQHLPHYSNPATEDHDDDIASDQKNLELTPTDDKVNGVTDTKNDAGNTQQKPVVIPNPPGIEAPWVVIAPLTKPLPQEIIIIITVGSIFAFGIIVALTLFVLYKKGKILKRRIREKERKRLLLHWDQSDIFLGNKKKYIKRVSRFDKYNIDLEKLELEKKRYMEANPNAKNVEIMDHVQAKLLVEI
ncbi:hypothetical protein HDU92_002699 [Lobulomyces angularis]|nr:hypothetical protein HDU92_002699 [Lobulomyces angularis]